MRNRTTTIQSSTKRLQARLALLSALIASSVVVGQQPQTQIAGVVSDQAGASISQASVEFQTNGGYVLRTRTSERGEFTLLSKTAVVVLRVQAAGFTPVAMN